MCLYFFYNDKVKFDVGQQQQNVHDLKRGKAFTLTKKCIIKCVYAGPKKHYIRLMQFIFKRIEYFELMLLVCAAYAM